MASLIAISGWLLFELLTSCLSNFLNKFQVSSDSQRVLSQYNTVKLATCCVIVQLLQQFVLRICERISGVVTTYLSGSSLQVLLLLHGSQWILRLNEGG